LFALLKSARAQKKCALGIIQFIAPKRLLRGFNWEAVAKFATIDAKN
jgi:hypothetical protein